MKSAYILRTGLTPLGINRLQARIQITLLCSARFQCPGKSHESLLGVYAYS